MRKKILIILIPFLIFSCGNKPREFDTKITIVNNKTRVKVKGTDCFILSFSNGESEYCTYGDYNYYKIGDTINWRRDKGRFESWFKIKK